MHRLIDLAFDRTRTVVLALLFLLVAGVGAYQTIPKEAEPDIPIPYIHVQLVHDGISPEDAERLLLRPLERELQGVEGLKEMQARAAEGAAAITLEFTAGFDGKRALDEVRQKVDFAKSELPAATEEPTVTEVNIALFPILTVALSGNLPERGLVRLARDLKDRIEALPEVLQAEIGGDREALLEVIVSPAVMETYGVGFEELFRMIQNNNLLVAAGAVDTGAGRLVLKVPGVVEDGADLLNMPVKVNGDQVVTIGQVAQVRQGFKDPEGFARIDGHPAVTLEIKKRLGANIIDTVAAVRALVEAERATWPDGVQVRFMQDKSREVRSLLGDLENNVIAAVLLVMMVIVAALGARSALLVGLAIPGAFLVGILGLQWLGYTMNIVVLFSLILVVGMLVDGAIVVIEAADRLRAEGADPRVAYAAAAKRMAWPVTAATLTTLMVFLPLLFWPGIVGEFMKFLPITVLLALSASLAMALIFVPVLGGLLGGLFDRGRPAGALAPGDGPVTRAYLRLLALLLRHPAKTLGAALLALVGAYAAYGLFGQGVEFFPAVEPERALVQVHARGDLSIWEKDAILRQVEARILGAPELRTVYARSFNAATGPEQAEDQIGSLLLELTDWQARPRADAILADLRARTADLPGLVLTFRKAEDGPAGGKPIQLELSARDSSRLPAAVASVRRIMDELGLFIDVEDNRPLPGIEWRLLVDREQAARHGADVATLGYAVQMVSTGIRVSGYRPEDQDDEVDIRVRFPVSDRNLAQLGQLRLPTEHGMVPIGNFVRLTPASRTGTISRVDGRRTLTIKADVAAGVLADSALTALRAALDVAGADGRLDPAVELAFKGQDAEQREAAQFLAAAFLTALFLMALILVTQFNRLYQALLVLSAIVFSTAGVLLGLLIAGQPFGVVMVGLGIIALAGIVVNNNIVLIDAYNQYRAEGLEASAAALASGGSRLRPVFLTAITTILGLLPMVLAMNIDLINRAISFGAPSTQWWIQLASAIAGGLAFATLLTLILTPALLVLGERVGQWLHGLGAVRST
ncbi:MAG: efflux RND transporter permease subunit [Chromatiaceae bacterium]|nr:MAG: efflux RND transporter permease subunit [Chromatiaceae bacterium]